MKSYKTMLLGIALILFGMACRIMTIGYISPGFLDHISIIFPFAGIITVFVGFFSKDNPKK